jgi:hypothetical protein
MPRDYPRRPAHLMVRDMTAEDSLAAFEHEIAAEKAASLGRAGERLEAAILALASFDRAPPAADRRAAREELVAIAAERLWYYVVQREAIGWHDHREALALYGVPGELQARMGPRPPGSAPLDEAGPDPLAVLLREARLGQRG